MYTYCHIKRLIMTRIYYIIIIYNYNMKNSELLWIHFNGSWRKNRIFNYEIIEPVQMNIYGQRISIIESFTVHIIILTLTCQIFYYFLVPLINIDTSTLLGWCTGNGRDSSVGRAEDWKSSCHQFKSGSWHVNNVSDRYSYKLIEIDRALIV